MMDYKKAGVDIEAGYKSVVQPITMRKHCVPILRMWQTSI